MHVAGADAQDAGGGRRPSGRLAQKYRCGVIASSKDREVEIERQETVESID
jgi:hypothetical protein